MPLRSNQRNIPIHRNSILRTRTPSNSRSNILGINNNLAIIHSITIALQRRPVLARGIPLLASGTHRTTLQILKRRLIRSDQTSTSTSFDRHVADGHTSLHTERTNGLSCEFNHRARPPRGPNDAANVQNNVLTGDALSQLSINTYEHIFSLGLRQCLRCKDVLYLRSTDTERERAKSSMSRGVAISAHTSSTWESETLLRSNDMHNSLSLIGHTKVFQIKILHILLQLQYLGAARSFRDKGLNIN
mmetsp:Transcript_19429/g.29945  ORF Transcript_19429/g.29945 Transcript_19429/m.29945 type:complete len:246 (-) Transcript_19429:465-1202(-)